MDCLDHVPESDKIIIIKNNDSIVEDEDAEECVCEDEEDVECMTENIGSSYIALSESDGKATIEAYRGETRKYSINVNVEGTKDSVHNIKLDKGSRAIISYMLPEYSCGSKMIAEGMDIIQEIELPCKEVKENISQNPKKISEINQSKASNITQKAALPEFKTFSFSNSTKQEIYESSAKQNKTYIIAGLTAITAVTAFVLLTRGSLKEFLDKR